MEWYMMALKRYAEFSGRSRRKEYWFFLLFNMIVMLLLGIVDTMLGTMVLGLVYSLAVFIPSLAVTVRRLHDIGKSGWWLLVAVIPFIGILVLLYFMVLDSEAGPNQFGANPKREMVEAPA